MDESYPSRQEDLIWWLIFGGATGALVAADRRLANAGDPLSGTLMLGYTLGGTTFHMQELAHFSWFVKEGL